MRPSIRRLRTRPGWHATVNGQSLRSTRAWGWAQSFVLPAGPGQVHVWYDGGTRRIELWVQVAVLLVMVVLAAPSVRRTDEEAPSPVADSLRPDEVWDLDGLDDLDADRREEPS